MNNYHGVIQRVEYCRGGVSLNIENTYVYFTDTNLFNVVYDLYKSKTKVLVHSEPDEETGALKLISLSIFEEEPIFNG